MAEPNPTGRRLASLSLAALGVVYGDIGTSPLYAFRACFDAEYGLAVTTVLFYVIARQRWHWSAVEAGALAGAFLAIDLAFFGANIVKIGHGGWVPVAIGGGVFLLMSTRHRGTELLRGFLARSAVPMDRFIGTGTHLIRGSQVFPRWPRSPAPGIMDVIQAGRGPVSRAHRAG